MEYYFKLNRLSNVIINTDCPEKGRLGENYRVFDIR